MKKNMINIPAMKRLIVFIAFFIIKMLEFLKNRKIDIKYVFVYTITIAITFGVLTGVTKKYSFMINNYIPFR